jgi:hypothetical protein
MRFVIIILALCITDNSYAQKHDYTWILGYSNNGDTTSEGGGLKIDFNYSPPKLTKLNTVLNFRNYAVSCSDSFGNLQFYTNGLRIYNRNYELMENGDTINPGDRWEVFNDDEQGYLGFSPITIPDPKGEEKYYMIHLGIYIDNGVKFGPLYCTKVDMKLNNGLGKVVSKNIILAELQQGTFSSPAAIKHANGRDWWVLVHVGGQATVLRYLVTPEGINDMGAQSLPLTYPAGGTATRCRASSDGMHYAILDGEHFFLLYDFDRCSGWLNNQKELDFQPPFFYSYCTFSPDSRFLYLSTSRTITQFDLMADTLSGNRLDTVQRFDFSNYPFDVFLAAFWDPSNAPDGKIYYTSSSTTVYMHPIHRPNLPGSACDFEIAGLRLPRFNYNTYFNFPNYRLGALTNSPCDTLGFKQPPHEGFVNTSYEVFLEQQTRSKRQVFRQTPPYTGKKDLPFNPESPEAIIEAEMKQLELNKAKN